MADAYNFSDVFISYARKDAVFVQRIANQLVERGYELWVDWEDIPKSADWWAEIQAGIDASNTMIFFVSPASAESTVCFQEAEYAVNNNKRVIPVLVEEPDGDLIEKLHPKIRSHNWMRFDDPDLSFDKAIDELIEALMLDLEHVRQHTRYLVRAREWETQGRDVSYLLRGRDARKAEDWLEIAFDKSPAPLPIHREYIIACERQSEIDQELSFQRRSLNILDARVLPTFFLSLLTVGLYVYLAFPAVSGGNTRFEWALGVGVTSSAVLALMVLYGEDLILVRYRNSRILRLGGSFVYSFVLSSAFLGFLQAWFFDLRLSYATIWMGWIAFAITPIMRATFRVAGWQSFLVAFVLQLVVLFNFSSTAATPWPDGVLLPLFYFETVEQRNWLAPLMAFNFALALNLLPMVMDFAHLAPQSLQRFRSHLGDSTP